MGEEGKHVIPAEMGPDDIVRIALDRAWIAGHEAGMRTGAANQREASVQSADDDTERVFALIERWADDMRDRGVEKLYDTAARYHLGLALKAFAKELRAETVEACARTVAAACTDDPDEIQAAISSVLRATP